LKRLKACDIRNLPSQKPEKPCPVILASNQKPEVCKFNPAGPLHAEIAALAGIGEYIDAVDDHH
jgi:hypothetical protein